MKRVSSEARSHHREISGHRHFSAFAPPPVFLSQKKKTPQNATPPSLPSSSSSTKKSAYVTIRNISLSPNRVFIEHRPTTQRISIRVPFSSVLDSFLSFFSFPLSFLFFCCTRQRHTSGIPPRRSTMINLLAIQLLFPLSPRSLLASRHLSTRKRKHSTILVELNKCALDLNRSIP